MHDIPHILFVAPFPPPVHGSAMVSDQIRGSVLINTTFNCDYVNIATSRRMDEVGKFSARKIFRSLYSFLSLLWKLAYNDYDLCYLAITCHGPGFLKDMPFALLCRLFVKRIVIHQHNKGMSSDVDNPVFRRLFHLVYDGAKVILLSWRLYPDIAKVVDRSQVMVCANGITNACAEGFTHTTSTVPHILFLSNLMIDKGVLVLLDAVQILDREGYSFICDFVGGESSQISSYRFSEEVSGRKLENKVFYHGRKTGVEKRVFFENADIFVLPSFNEALPLVNIEAMEYGLPIVTTDVGGIPDQVEDGVNGLLVKPRDSVALSAAVRKLLDNPSLASRMGRAGRLKFENQFTLQRFETSMVECLRKSL